MGTQNDNQYWTLPKELTEKIVEQFTSERKNFALELKDFIDTKLEEMDNEVWEFVKGLNWDEPTTLFRALNLQKEYGVFLRNGKKHYIDLLCYFAFNQNWETTKKRFRITDSAVAKREKYKPVTAIDAGIANELSQLFFAHLHKSAKAEFDTYMALPEFKIEHLKEFFWEDSSAFKKLVYPFMEDKIKAGLVINNENNCSTYEFYEMKVLKIEDTKAYIETEEYWQLNWFNINTKTYDPEPWEMRNRQVYTFEKRGEIWKIKSCYFPYRENI